MEGLQGLCSHCAWRAWQVWRDGVGRRGGGGFALAMGQTQHRLASRIKAVLRALCWCARTNLIDINLRKREGEASRVGLLFGWSIVMVTAGTSADKAPARPPWNFSAWLCICMCVKKRINILLAFSKPKTQTRAFPGALFLLSTSFRYSSQYWLWITHTFIAFFLFYSGMLETQSLQISLMQGEVVSNSSVATCRVGV